MYKQRLDVEMFKVTKESFTHRLSQTSELVNSRRRKLVYRLRAKTAFGSNPCYLEEPLWGYLNNETTDIDNVNKFKSAANEILIKQGL